MFKFCWKITKTAKYYGVLIGSLFSRLFCISTLLEKFKKFIYIVEYPFPQNAMSIFQRNKYESLLRIRIMHKAEFRGDFFCIIIFLLNKILQKICKSLILCENN